MQDVVAVLDLGKTNLKVLVAGADGRPVDSLSRPHDFVRQAAWLAIDIAGVEEFFLDALAELGRRHPIRAIVATAHGCGAVLVDDEGPVLPMVDYETPCPAWLDEAYDAEAPAYAEVFCSTGPGAIRLAKQLLWQERAFPRDFGRARHYLTTAQYLAWRLGGRPASEVSQLAAQGHLWDPRRGEPSAIVRRHGWDRLFPPRAKAGETLGPLGARARARTGLAGEVAVLCGVHDSNANLYRYKAAGLADRAVLSTGTWMIGFVRGRPLDTLDAGRGMVSNIDVDGEPVASTLTMTGREYALLAGDARADDGAVLDAAARLVARGTLALPSFVPDDGLFPGSSMRGRIEGPPPRDDAERLAVAALYAAFTANLCLDALGGAAPLVIDGGFASNVPFGRLVAALRPGRAVAMSRSRDGTALGAALLWNRFDRKVPVAEPELVSMPPAAVPGLGAAAARWAALADTLVAR